MDRLGSRGSVRYSVFRTGGLCYGSLGVLRSVRDRSGMAVTDRRGLVQ